jgi:septum formation protein
MAKFILASASPRRVELLNQVGLEFDIIPSNIEEIIDNNDSPSEIVKKLSKQKASDVAGKINTSGKCYVIGADTIVVSDKILGKPATKEEAFSMLKMLSGKPHKVMTGVTVIETDTMKAISDYEETAVFVRELSDNDIYSYIATGEPFDKAGGYGIQGMGALLVDRIDGCYFNVVGLPLARLSKMLENFNIYLL